MKDYSRYYNESGFWKKVGRVALNVGRDSMKTVLAMYYCMKDPDTPYWAKSILAGALGYFILPLDLVPDMVPVVGYGDDIALLLSAISTVGAHMKDEHWEMAEEKLSTWFN